jgi:putative flavoprotein involved in K+ transport
MLRVLERIDRCIVDRGLEAPDPDPATRVPFLAAGEPVTLDMAREGVRTVVWATGYVRRYPWLNPPALDGNGEIIHRAGVAAYPGLYAIGLTYLRRRRSAFIDGCGLDAEDLAPMIQAYLDGCSKKAA